MDKKFLEVSQVKLRGVKEVEGMKFHDIEGGFGEGKKAMIIKEIAEIHNKPLGDINRRINDNIKRFKDGIDIVDLMGTNVVMDLKHNGIYTQNSINRSENIYLLSERGYSKLLKILEDDVAWEQYEKLVDGYFNMREEINVSKPVCIEDVLISSLQEMKAIKGEVQAVKVATQENQEALQGIRDVVAINTSTMSWREDCRKIIVRIAHKLGGNSFIGDVNREIYELMRVRLKVRLDVKLTNLRRRMADEGVCKSKREKMNYLDVIKDESRLVEGYVAIIKELAVKYGADVKEA
ncbi:ORF6N domain-containing protein [Clostridium botulinum]|uniref:Phage protein n=1 Tax=Clostridium botulinum (strain Eklund 17B / Type B) TaxID=935198 RepID=B2TMD5_CLOBB|nr:ORF6N domain-containing protein [Clostridium botulinum]ACD23093.1 phage protein [Clostridium botulinum B str. Eklund 17B (NRP)]MBY6976790.1 ORF6N domain-containing protein [Clostridium botulinum]MBY7002283.1 ORF6N domain-containing protein [Clostridium botulinum]MCR1274114.1 ORF6N domain-containing protein [Clostridium botulinum]NFD68793.1 ORF6N domain-containing protein [Clostridium botulinum]